MRTVLFASLLPLCAASSLAASTPPDSSLASRAEALVRREIPADGPGVSVLLARGSQVIYRGARGRADVELAVPLDAGDVFRIGSITKPFTATTVMTLVADGTISVDDPLSRFIPDYPGGDTIRIFQLLDHTAGVSDAWEVDPAHELGTADLVSLISHQPPSFAPGTVWEYSNSGYMLLGAVIEAVTGESWAAAMSERVLEPLGLAHTGYFGDSELVPDRALGYTRDVRGETVPAPYVSMSGPGAAGALSSTVDDLFGFVHGLATHRLLSPALYDSMTTAKKTSEGRPVPYGYGWMLGAVRGQPVVEHNGGIAGFASQLTYFPAEDVTVVVLANSDDGPSSPRSIAHRLGAMAIGDPYRSFERITLDARTLEELAGRYRIDATSTHTLFVHGDTLFVQRDGGPARQLVEARGGLLFYPGDETDYYEVLRGANGHVEGLEFFVDGMEPGRREARIAP